MPTTYADLGNGTGYVYIQTNAAEFVQSIPNNTDAKLNSLSVYFSNASFRLWLDADVLAVPNVVSGIEITNDLKLEYFAFASSIAQLRLNGIAIGNTGVETYTAPSGGATITRSVVTDSQTVVIFGGNIALVAPFSFDFDTTGVQDGDRVQIIVFQKMSGVQPVSIMGLSILGNMRKAGYYVVDAVYSANLAGWVAWATPMENSVDWWTDKTIPYQAIKTGASASIFMTDGSLDGVWNAMSGDATIDALGALTIANSVVTPAKSSTALKTIILTYPFSFESGEQGLIAYKPNIAGTLTQARIVTQKAIAGTDDGTVVLQISGTIITGGSFTVVASTAINTAQINVLTANNTFNPASQNLEIVTSKVTAGGKGWLELTLVKS